MRGQEVLGGRGAVEVHHVERLRHAVGLVLADEAPEVAFTSWKGQNYLAFVGCLQKVKVK